MKIAIHQPDFFPWLGYFHKLNLVDKFVHFDHVEAPTGKHWTSRNKILLGGEEKWLTIPIKKKGKLDQKYYQIEINYESNFKRKHLGTIQQAYRKSEFYDEIFPVVKEIYDREHKLLLDFNRDFIDTVSARLGVQTDIFSSKELLFENPNLVQLSGNNLILELCVLLEATEYISGTGCLDFIDPLSFERKGVKFKFQNFTCHTYHQVTSQSKFVSHLSILDAIFNIGFDGVKKIISDSMVKEV